MIFILKQLLFEILDTIEPNDILTICLPSGANAELVRPDSTFPVALRIEESFDQIQVEPMLEELNNITNTFRNFYRSPESVYESDFEKDHTIEYNNKKYIITDEITSIEYNETYVKIGIASRNGKHYNYVPYEHIDAIRYIEERRTNIVKEYNSLMYNLMNQK